MTFKGGSIEVCKLVSRMVLGSLMRLGTDGSKHDHDLECIQCKERNHLQSVTVGKGGGKASVLTH